MSWLDELKAGSFRGAKFWTTDSEAQFARRVVAHQYPLRDGAQYEDLGRKQRRFKVQAFVVGDDYLTARDALRTALEQAGAGELVHRYYGKLQAVALSCSIRESTRDGGMASFDIEFAEAGDAFGAVQIDKLAELAKSGTSTLDEVANDFADEFSILDQIDSVVSAGRSVVQDATSAIRRVNSKINSGLAGVQALARDIDAIDDELSSLLRSPFELASAIASVLGAVAALANTPERIRNMYGALYEQRVYGADAKPVEGQQYSASKQRQQANQDATIKLMRSVAAITAASHIQQVSFSSQTDAYATIDLLGDWLLETSEQASLATASSTSAARAAATASTVIALDQVRLQAVELARSSAAGLGNLHTRELKATLPAVVIAQEFGCDYQSIIDNNPEWRHPLFVGAGAINYVV